METARLSPPIQAFDVSRIVGLRKKLGRAATALKVIGFVCCFFIGFFQLESSHDFRLALLVALLTFGFASIVANRLRAGRLWAVVLAAICCGWWTVRNFPLWLFAKPQAILGYAGIPMAVVYVPAYFLAQGLLAVTAYRWRHWRDGRSPSDPLALNPYEEGLGIRKRPRFLNKKSMAAYSLVVLSSNTFNIVLVI